MDDALLYLASTSRRPPDWRWRLAVHLDEHDRRLGRTRADRGVTLARTFLSELREANSDLKQLALAERRPALFDAWSLYKGLLTPHARWEVEARLLATEATKDISHKTGFSEETISTYEAMFFDVQGKPHGYIMHVVLAEAAKRGISEREPDMLWKMFGYWSGPLMLDMLVYRCAASGKLDAGASVGAFLADDIHQQLQLKSTIAIRSMQINWQTQTEIVNLYLRMAAKEKELGGNINGQESLAAGIQSLLENLPWTKSAAQARKRNLIFDLEANGAGLRADEMLLIAAGQTPPGLKEKMESAVFPPPVRRTTLSN